MCAVCALTVMHVLLFVLHVCMRRRCEGDGNAGVGDDGGVVVVSAGHEYVVIHMVQVLCLVQLTC